MIVVVIPTLHHPPTLRDLLSVLQRDGIEAVVLDTTGREPDIYKWWNEGCDKARSMGATEIAVLNDDIMILPGTLPFMAKALRSDPTVALVSPELAEWARPDGELRIPKEVQLRYSIGHGGGYTTPSFTGWNFMFKADLDLPRFDEGYRWYWGDQAFEEDVRKAGFRVASVLGLVADHQGAATSKRVGGKVLSPLKLKDLVRWADVHEKAHPEEPSVGPMPPILWRHNLLRHGQEQPKDSARFWAQFGTLNPGLEQRLVSSPLDAVDWPETSWLWSWASHVVQLADLLRFETLWTHGGIFVDWDVEPYRSLEVLLPIEGFVSYEVPTTVGSAVMGFRPHHPSVGKMLDRAIDRCIVDHTDLMGTGPRAVTFGVKGRNDVLLLPPDTFFMGSQDWPGRLSIKDGANTTPWVYAVHRMHGSWVSEFPWRREYDVARGDALPVRGEEPPLRRHALLGGRSRRSNWKI